MTSGFARNVRRTASLGMLSALLLTSAAQGADNAVEVTVDRASVLRAPQGMSTVIIGNPLIADVTSQRNGVLVVTGKSFGTTNVMMLDATGQVLSESLITVRRAQDGVVVVQRGAKRESMACNPRCEPVLAIGDSAEAFGATAGQITQRSGLSSGRAD